MSRRVARRDLSSASAPSGGKFGVPKDPFELEQAASELVPDSDEEYKRMMQICDHLVGNPGLTASERNAVEIYKTQLMTERIPGLVKTEFLRNFWAWLLGRGPAALHEPDRTPWGRASLADDPEVAAYIDMFVVKMDEFKMKLTLLKMRRPIGIKQAWLFYKYVANKQQGSRANFLADWELFNQDFDLARGQPQDEERNRRYENPNRTPYVRPSGALGLEPAQDERDKRQDGSVGAWNVHEMAPYGDARKRLARENPEDAGASANWPYRGGFGPAGGGGPRGVGGAPRGRGPGPGRPPPPDVDPEDILAPGTPRSEMEQRGHDYEVASAMEEEEDERITEAVEFEQKRLNAEKEKQDREFREFEAEASKNPLSAEKTQEAKDAEAAAEERRIAEIKAIQDTIRAENAAAREQSAKQHTELLEALRSKDVAQQSGAVALLDRATDRLESRIAELNRQSVNPNALPASERADELNSMAAEMGQLAVVLRENVRSTADLISVQRAQQAQNDALAASLAQRHTDQVAALNELRNHSAEADAATRREFAMWFQRHQADMADLARMHDPRKALEMQAQQNAELLRLLPAANVAALERYSAAQTQTIVKTIAAMERSRGAEAEPLQQKLLELTNLSSQQASTLQQQAQQLAYQKSMLEAAERAFAQLRGQTEMLRLENAKISERASQALQLADSEAQKSVSLATELKKEAERASKERFHLAQLLSQSRQQLLQLEGAVRQRPGQELSTHVAEGKGKEEEEVSTTEPMEIDTPEPSAEVPAARAEEPVEPKHDWDERTRSFYNRLSDKIYAVTALYNQAMALGVHVAISDEESHVMKADTVQLGQRAATIVMDKQELTVDNVTKRINAAIRAKVGGSI